MLLGEIADVRLGRIYSRYKFDSPSYDNSQNIYALTTINVSDLGIDFKEEGWKRLNGYDVSDKSLFLETNDILFKYGNINSSAVYIDSETAKKNIFASNAFFIIKLDEKKIIDKLNKLYKDSGNKFIFKQSDILTELKEALSKYICVYLNSISDEFSKFKEEKSNTVNTTIFPSIEIPITAFDSINNLNFEIVRMKETFNKINELNKSILALQKQKASELSKIRGRICDVKKLYRDLNDLPAGKTLVFDVPENSYLQYIFKKNDNFMVLESGDQKISYDNSVSVAVCYKGEIIGNTVSMDLNKKEFNIKDDKLGKGFIYKSNYSAPFLTTIPKAIIQANIENELLKMKKDITFITLYNVDYGIERISSKNFSIITSSFKKECSNIKEVVDYLFSDKEKELTLENDEYNDREG